MRLLPELVIEPAERISEILFGLIMALTVTGATSVITADRFQIRTMLIAALGCNIAWGIIDGGMYLMARVAERGSNALLLRKVRAAADRESAHRIIADALPPLFRSAAKIRRPTRTAAVAHPEPSEFNVITISLLSAHCCPVPPARPTATTRAPK
jgi:hypothetical protein